MVEEDSGGGWLMKTVVVLQRAMGVDGGGIVAEEEMNSAIGAVSYTHLTLPTIYSV